MKANVKATRDFIVGINTLVIPAGTVRTVEVRKDGKFTTTTIEGYFFGWCSIHDGWEIERVW